MPRPVLIICPAFYPYPAVAAVRATNWARLLPSRGWTPHIAARSPGPELDQTTFDSEVHPDVVLHPLGPHTDGLPRGATSRSLKQRIRSLIPSDAFVPDPSIVFWRRQHAVLAQLVRDIKPDALITTGPPQSIHLTGLALHKSSGIPWVADFRDPQLMDGRFLPRGVFKPLMHAQHKVEQRIYAHASATTHAIEMQDRWARLRYASVRDRCVFLPHFCPPDLVDGSVEPVRAPEGRRSIRAVGHLGDDQALAIAGAIDALVKHEGMDLELRHAGKSPASAPEIESLLGDRAIFEGRVAHDRARALVAGGDVLIAALAPERAPAVLVSSKLYEYIAARRPIVVINPSRQDRHLLRAIPYARVLRTPAAEQLRTTLAAALSDRVPNQESDAVIARYSMERHADTLTSVLERIGQMQGGTG